MQEIYEKLGLFYLGKDVDKSTMDTIEALTLLKNKNFTTHAAIIGMTGSGKTGLGVSIIEEAAIDNIPSIIIDPKGDMGNLCLIDDTFLGKNFEPWVLDEANTKNLNVTKYANEVATMWKEGIQSWDQNVNRVSRLQAVKKTIYTPGASSGVSINIMSSLEVPPVEIMKDSDTFSSYLKSTATSLLSLLGINADPLDSKEYILLAQIITKAWFAQEHLTIPTLITKIITPSFKKIGVLSLEDFYPKDKRFTLATKFNNLLASPSFSMWLEGENLDIQKLLYDEQGKAKVAIFSISHLNDDERMFFVTLLLNKYITWMRRQSGTSALKTLLYMDEIYGFFPPSKNPPSKEPMLLLLKQARAFGIGIVLSTQNPVDLDYKGLSNIGTWFIGRLQTTQDIERVIDGLGGKIGSSFDKNEIKTILANLKKRTFFLKSAHLEDIRLFSTRWVMSYLKGPLKRDEISILMKDQKEKKSINSSEMVYTNSNNLQSYQDIDESITQYYEPVSSEKKEYYPTLSAKVKIHFYQQRRSIDIEKEEEYSLLLEASMKTIMWDQAKKETLMFTSFPSTKPSNASFGRLPDIIAEDKGLKKAIRDLKQNVYRTENLTLYRSSAMKLESIAEESLSDFTVRVQDKLNEKKEIEIEKLQERYAKKEDILLKRLARAKERVEKESSDSTSSMIETGIAVLGALFGKSSPTKIGAAFRKGNKVLKERGDMSRSQERMRQVEDDIETLEYELEDNIDSLNEKFTMKDNLIESFSIKPRKIDIDVEVCAVVWRG